MSGELALIMLVHRTYKATDTHDLSIKIIFQTNLHFMTLGTRALY